MSDNSNTPFTAIYAQWLESFRALMPGGGGLRTGEEPTPKQEQVAANQEWEDEGGSIKPVPVAEVKDAPKIPF